MLYASRFNRSVETAMAENFAKSKGMPIDANEVRVGVVDTDDGVEELISIEELRNLVMDFNIIVLGSGPLTYRDVDDCLYQSDEYVTGLQAKYLALGDVRVTTWKGMITGIGYTRTPTGAPISIRLSDICDVCSDYLLLPIPITHGIPERHVLTLVIDDKLKFSEYTFSACVKLFRGIGVDGFGIQFDIRELSLDKKAFMIYKNVVWSGSMVTSILDSDSRKKAMYEKLRSIGMA